jgi:ArsR family transcriptional regulator, lead/cadmium/zinc/bismuth-responsive transcriptional repressor
MSLNSYNLIVEQLFNYRGITMKDKNQYSCDCEVIHEDIVKRVLAVLPPIRDFHSLANLYKMFADNTRVKILFALSLSPMCVCDLAVLLKMTKSAVSHQLKLLRLSNLVINTKQGKVVFYSLADDHVKDIFEKGFEHIREGINAE